MSWNWRFDAACRGGDSEVFFPESHGEVRIAQIYKAKAICGRCPVAGDCLDWAIEEGIPFGVFGGLDEAERRRMGARPRHGNRAVPALLKCRNNHDLTVPDATFFNSRLQRCCVKCKANRTAAALSEQVNA